jgi:hypothetical protein
MSMVRSNHTAATNGGSSRWVIGALSVLLNAALIAVLIHLLGVQQPAAKSVDEAAITPVGEKTAGRAAVKRHSAPRVPLTFDWKSLVSTDYVAYAENLRAVKCPEKTIRDIVLPLIDKSFEDRKEALKAAMPFWQTGSQRELAEREQARRCAELDKQQMELVRQALGFEWNTEALSACDDMEAYLILGFLPQDNIERAFSILANFGNQFKASHDQALGVVTAEDCDERRNLYNQAVKAACAEVGEAGFDEAQLRLSLLASSWKIPPDLSISAAEARQWMRIMNEDRLLIAAQILNDNADIQEQSQLGRFLFETHLRQLLGNERFVKYTRSEDSNFDHLAAAFDRKGLSHDKLLSAFDLMQTTEAGAIQIRKRLDLRNSQRKQELKALRQSSTQALAQLLDEPPDADVIRTNAPWLSESK